MKCREFLDRKDFFTRGYGNRLFVGGVHKLTDILLKGIISCEDFDYIKRYNPGECVLVIVIKIKQVKEEATGHVKGARVYD